MAYDNALADRVREIFDDVECVREIKMFGGLCIMVNEHMCCGVLGDRLIARLGGERAQAALKRKHAALFDFTGKPMKGILVIDQQGLKTKAQLQFWIDAALEFVSTLPPKKPKKKKAARFN